VKDLILFLPELYLILTAIGLILGEVGYHGERIRMILSTALLAVGGAGLQLIFNYTAGAGRYGHGNFLNDGFGLYLKLLLLLSAGIALFADRKSHEVSLESRTEHATLILGTTALGMLVVSAVHWIWILFLLFGIQVLGSMIFAMKKFDRLAIEAAFKGNFLAIYSTMLLAIAVLLFYSSTGEFDLYRIHAAIAEHGIQPRVFATGFSLIVLAIGFFGTYFPAQLWAKDAYEGAALPTTAYASCLFRLSSFGVLLRVLVIQFSKETDVKGFWEPITAIGWTPVIATIAGVTLIMSALYVFRQTTTRKLLAGVLVLQSGFYLLGILSLDQVGFASILFGLATEVVVVGGLFSALSFFEDRRDEVENRGHLSRSVPEGVALLLFLVAVIGLPPLPGFIAKFTLISSAARHSWNGLVSIALLSLILMSIAVFRWVYPWICELRHRNESFSISWSHRFLVLGLLVPLALLSIFAEPMLNWVGASVAFNLW
jgi:NADH-quinone oxidoreductase subunit N